MFRKKQQVKSELGSALRDMWNKPVVLIGAGRAALDFMYVFPNVKVLKCIEIRGEERAEKLPVEVIPANRYKVASEERFFVVCTTREKDAVSYLKRKKLKKYENWVLNTEYAFGLNFPEIMWKSKKIFLWVTSDELVTVAHIDSVYGMNGFIDAVICDKSVEHNRTTDIKWAESPNELFEYKDECCIILAGANKKQAREYLKSEAMDTYCYYRGEDVSELFSKLESSVPITMARCSHPWTFIEILPCKNEEGYKNAPVNLCCPVFLSPAAGSIKENNFEEIWKGSIARIQRCSVINHTFAFCDLNQCRYKNAEYMRSNILQLDSIVEEDAYYEDEIDYPKHVAIDIDNTCNLYCRYCREERMIATGEEKKDLEEISQKIITQILPHANEIMLAGNGEVFASKIYRNILYADVLANMKIKPRLQLTTNGLLFNKDNFEKLEMLYREIELWVSIDAASKELYNKVRRGGNWENLRRNMEYAAQLRRENRIKYFRLNYIVTAESYIEMPAFVQWAKELDVDSVLFQRVAKTEAISDEEYERISIFNADGIMKEEYRDFFQQEIFKEAIVNKDNNVIH